MAPGMRVPQIGQMKSEIGKLEGQKSGIESQRESMRKGLSTLKSKKGELDSAISDLRSKLIGEIPPNIRKQITERLSVMKNSRRSLVAQISMLSERLAQSGEALKGLRVGINARKRALERIAGQMTRLPMYNREMGKKKA